MLHKIANLTSVIVNYQSFKHQSNTQNPCKSVFFIEIDM